ncbi:MAG: 3-methyl-2-oxobutanoate dehydrogenase subunit VorB [Oscillospiraceae bacterium]|nr:3-methyl-2-oxobutanoate dehydrogenase subunit VorB [Oscillospiraceae bacterium]
MKREIWKGSEAIAEAAIRAGCRGFFGYPITPQNEIPEYMSLKMPQSGGVFVQAESELAAINMVYGAAASGMRAMTSSSSPGISLKQEGISYMVGAELPGVIVNVMRGGPGLGSIQPGQSDYFQATRGGGNGDYRMVVLAPANLQEAVDLMADAFDIADQYRNPVMVLADGLIGQMMEPIVWKEHTPRALPEKTWAADGRHGREHNNFITSLLLEAAACEERNIGLKAKFDEMEKNECRWEEVDTADAEIILVAYGTPARIAMSAARQLREQGIKAGVVRPITLWPFPHARVRELAEGCAKVFLTVEMSQGQMVEDVQMAVGERKPVKFYGRCGGVVPTVSEVRLAAEEICKEVL